MMQPPQHPGVVQPTMTPMSMDQQQPPSALPQQYGQVPPVPQQQPWAMVPPQQQPLPPTQMWPQQPPQAPQIGIAPPTLQIPQGQSQQFPAASPTNPDEVRSLWIGDLQYWMEENYLWGCFGQTGEVVSVKVIRNKQTGQGEGYGFIEFVSRAAAERVLLTYNGTPMPTSDQVYRLNWATLGAGQKKQDDDPDYTIFVGDLAADVTDYILQETFRAHYPSVKGAKVITDHLTGRSKGYGFVKFGDESEQQRSMSEMNGMFCSTRPMRIGPAANKKPQQKEQEPSGSRFEAWN